jgi:hypothetical protein
MIVKVTKALGFTFNYIEAYTLVFSLGESKF